MSSTLIPSSGPIAAILGSRAVVESDGTRAVLLGHLALSPLSALTLNPESVASAHTDPVTACETLRRRLVLADRDGDLVCGSLWSHPGVGRVTATEPMTIVPVL